MALLFMEGFELNDTSVLTTQGQIFGASTTITASNRHLDYAGNGGNYCMAFSSTASAWYTPGLGGTSGREATFYMYVGSTPNVNPIKMNFLLAGNEQCAVWFEATGYVKAVRGSSVVQATSTLTFAQNAGYWVEVYCEAKNSGRIRVKLNGVTYLDVTATDFQQEASPDWDRIHFDSNTNNPFSFDDFYIWDTIDSMPYGSEEYIVILQVDSDVATGLTPSTGGTNYVLVDEIPPSASDYNEGTSSGLEDEYGVTNLPWSPTAISIVASGLYCSRDGTLTTWTPFIRSGATRDNGSGYNPGASGVSTLNYQYWEVDPNTASAWTEAAVNALQIGATVT